jgi:dihydrofolate reductase
VTKIDLLPHSDAFFPDLDADPAWHVTDRGRPLEEDGLRYRFLTYERLK